MMGDTNVNTIWRPVVRSTEVPPTQSDPSRAHQSYSSYTEPQQLQSLDRTSLAHDNNSSEELTRAKQMNQRILEASQLFNRTPKPFVRHSSVSERDLQFDSKQQQLSPGDPGRQLERSNSQQISGQAGVISDMSPKLVHQQYNSPLDLYSMSNIRKTIEAHSEMIAPGVKGINFMKGDPPINKNSEVLKLVKEEEEQRRLRQQQQPASAAEPTRLPYPSAPIQGPPHRPVQYACEQSAGSGSTQQATQNQQLVMRPVLKQQGAAPPLVNKPGESKADHDAPKCFECGQPIVGPFAKLQDRFVHPQCFNCSTCGTSLKNSGYFTINDKLYCDIHARQVANVMRLNYNFEPNKQAVICNQPEVNEHTRPNATTHQVLLEKKSSGQLQGPHQHPQPQPVALTVDHQPKSPTTSANVGTNQGSHCLQFCSGKSNQATTISTMFSGVGHHCQQCNNHCNRRSEIRWTWRPANHSSDVINCQHQKLNSTENMLSSSTATMSSRSLADQKNRYETRLTASTASGNRTSDMSGTGSDRVPVCHHCRVHIHGPYILAGKSTWCKPCSQTNFFCNSCRCSLLDIGFIEDAQTGKYNCERCFETYLAPMCSKCHSRIKGDCLKALGKQWHPNCFVCGHCRCSFANSSFYLEDNVPYCERDWNLLFTTKCYTCGYPIQIGDKWIEALQRNYHSDCFRCTGCQVKLEGSTFYCKGGKPYCTMHAR